MADTSIHHNTISPSTTARSIKPWAILLAAGSGTRMARHTGNTAKQFLIFQDLPLYWHSAKTLASCSQLQGIIFVFPAHCLEEERQRLHVFERQRSLGLPWVCVAGGQRRQDSVWQGLQALPARCEHVLIHDSARPFVTASLVERVCSALGQGAPGAIPGLPVSDTIKEEKDGWVVSTPERKHLRAVQTPQGFNKHILCSAHLTAQRKNWDVTDDAALLERCQHPVRIVMGEANNYKITTPEDLSMLQQRTLPLPCTGFGYDVHRFGTGRPLKLGGILMDGKMEVLAHSDGDVLLHALMDAILGCTSSGDIGLHFPDSSSAFDNADSAVLLDEVLRLSQKKGLTILHVDLTIITQKPKIGPQRNAIQKSVAHLLGLPIDRVNVKATTEEGLGFTGNGEGIKAVALVTGQRSIIQ